MISAVCRGYDISRIPWKECLAPVVAPLVGIVVMEGEETGEGGCPGLGMAGTRYADNGVRSLTTELNSSLMT